jgi:tight adherence protein B
MTSASMAMLFFVGCAVFVTAVSVVGRPAVSSSRLRRLQPSRPAGMGPHVLHRLFPTIHAKIAGTAPPPPQEKPSVGRAGLALIQRAEDLLRTGTSPSHTWRTCAIPTTADGIPILAALESMLLPPKPTTSDRHHAAHLAQMIVSTCTVTHTLGLSLKTVLSAIQEVIEHEIDATEERRIALAGPRASAFMLQMLPLVGVLGSVLLGIDPTQWFFGSVLGMVNLCAGVTLLVVGRTWTAKLIKTASKSASSSP